MGTERPTNRISYSPSGERSEAADDPLRPLPWLWTLTPQVSVQNMGERP